MRLSPDALVAVFRADPNWLFSEEELRTLETAAFTSLWAAKAAALQCIRSKDIRRALPLLLSIAKREPTSESVGNAVVGLRSLEKFSEALVLLKSNEGRFEPVEYEDLLCSLHGLLGDIDDAVAHGDEALRLKDASVAAIPAKTPRLRKFVPEQRSKNVISFSVWGSEARYLNGAITNSIVARYLYPGWTARFYTDSSTSEEFRQALARQGAQVVLVTDLPAQKYGLFWRFLVEDDAGVSLFLVRDADSVLNVRERWAVADWLTAGTVFHVMRDNPQHSELMLAGMWGAHRGNIRSMRKRVVSFIEGGGSIANDLSADQRFLRTCIWPIARDSVTIHDSFFNFRQPRRFSPDFPLPSDMHVGENDWVTFGRASR
jgi:hypothetical protein